MCNNFIVAQSMRMGLAAKVGAWAGAICAVHCVLTAVGLGLLSVAGFGFLGSPIVEASFVGVLLVTGIWALLHGLRRHHSWIPACVFIFGLALIAASHFAVEAGGTRTQGSVSVVLAVAGGLCIAAFQFVNLRIQHRGCACERRRLGRQGHVQSAIAGRSERVTPAPSA